MTKVLKEMEVGLVDQLPPIFLDKLCSHIRFI